MASHPPRAECCTTGVKHEGTPTGKLIKFGGSRQHDPVSGAVLVLTDVLGHNFINSQLIADQFAAKGYFTVVPDLFNGDAVPALLPEGFPKFEDWLSGDPGHLPNTVDPIVTSVVREMRDGLGCKRVFAAGYCFGAKYVVRHLKPGFIDVGYLVHPTMVDESELELIQGPLCIDAAEVDPVFPTDKRHRSEEILIKTGQPYQMTVFGGVEHGFAVRADYSKPRVRYARNQSFAHCMTWFEEFAEAKSIVRQC